MKEQKKWCDIHLSNLLTVEEVQRCIQEIEPLVLCKIINVMSFSLDPPLTFHCGQSGVWQQRQGEHKQEIHHRQTIVAEQTSWDAEERTQMFNVFGRNCLVKLMDTFLIYSMYHKSLKETLKQNKKEKKKQLIYASKTSIDRPFTQSDYQMVFSWHNEI